MPPFFMETLIADLWQLAYFLAGLISGAMFILGIRTRM